MARKDQLFQRFIAGMIVVMILYGIGMVAVIILTDNNAVESRMVTAFSSMFAGILGLGAGYLLGKNGGSNGESH